MKEAWKKCYLEYWNFVTKIENNWIWRWEQELAEKKIWDDNKLRNGIIWVSYHTFKMLKDLKEKQIKQDEIEKWWRAWNDKENVEKLNYIKMMEIDSQKWPDYDKGLKTNLVIPQSIYHQ